MKDLTLVIPAKEEWDSLPKVLEELKTLECKIIVVLDRSDIETINSINNYNCEVIYQSGKGYGNAIIEGIKNTKTEFLCVKPKTSKAKNRFANMMDNLHSCKVEQRENGKVFLASISGRYFFWMNEINEDTHWEIIQ